MTTPSRAAGLGLLTYTIGTTAGFVGLGAPGGEYHADQVATYVSSGHYWHAFAFGYLGALSVLGLLVFGHAARALWQGIGETIWALTIAAVAISLVGGFVVTGLVVSFAEGGQPVQGGVPHPVVYVFGEIGNLLALCGPAFFMGVVAIVLAVRAGLPTWLRLWGVAAGVCGILLPFYFTIPVYLLWSLAFAVWLTTRGSRSVAPVTVQAQGSLV